MRQQELGRLSPRQARRCPRTSYGEKLTAWAVQVETDDIDNLPAEPITLWEWAGVPGPPRHPTGRLRELVVQPQAFDEAAATVT
jgi:hypothetical protein